jgi:FkbM family methyltransferase
MHGEWAFAEQLLISRLILADDVVWDVGAFLGTFGIGVTRLSETAPAKLVAVEPSAALYPHLLANLERNAPCPFQIAPFAAGATSGRLRPCSGTGEGNAGAIAYEAATDGTEAEGDVICKSLQDLRAEYGDYDVLKLDIEGMENDAIRGDIDYILNHRPVIWAECNESLSSILLLEALIWLKYEPVYVAFPAFRRQNFNGSTEAIYPMAYEAVLLAAPPKRLTSFHAEVPGEDIIVRPVKTSFDLRRALWNTPRWSMPEWAELSKPELVARLGRNQRQEELVAFLADTPPSDS